MLKVNNICCAYGKEIILKDINFTINKGEIVGIIGPNGSGKTTLLRAVTKIIPLQNGNVFFQNNDIQMISVKQFSQYIAVVSQIIDIEMTMTVEEFIALGRIPYRKKFQFFENINDITVIENVMKLTDTYFFRQRTLKTLSGGEKQLVIIARALVQEPTLLFLDEPTNHLDISHQIKVLNLIKKINQENGLTVAIVLHDLNLASEYCDRLILLNKGIIHCAGTPDEVLQLQIIEKVYSTKVTVGKNPISGKPYVFLVCAL